MSDLFLKPFPLQGHIGVDTAVFPENTPGFVLDVFARSSLWKIGLDYRHGIVLLDYLASLLLKRPFCLNLYLIRESLKVVKVELAAALDRISR